MAGIYTKRGDAGETSLYGGSRVAKDDLRVESYGTLDEANAMLGVAYAQLSDEQTKASVRLIQQKLFVVGAELASDPKGISMLKEKIGEEDIRTLEQIVDRCYQTVAKQTEFVIPGVNTASASLHVARTIIRRAERLIAALAREQSVRKELSSYVNRLSDAIYSLARYEETMDEINQIKEMTRAILKAECGRHEGSEFSLEMLKKLAAYAEEKANEIGVPIVFSACDAGGNLVLMHRMEGSLLGSIDISANKAYTACAFKMPTDRLGTLATPDQPLYGIQNTNDGKVVLFGGGYPYYCGDKVVGGIGVSGGSVEEDMCIAQYALDKIQKGVEQ